MKKGMRKIEKILDIPEGIVDDIPIIKAYGYEKVMISNYTGIIEYEEYIVRLNSNLGIVCIWGSGLKISELNLDDIIISGSIKNIEFER